MPPAKVKAGETVVTIGTGGVSVFAMQWAKMLGARVIVTSSSDEKLAKMEELGADDVINYRTHPEWSKQVMELTGGRGAEAVINNVGTSEMDQCSGILRIVRPGDVSWAQPGFL